ncbi:MAG: HNH endonuclease [Pirellulales bacterium]|nr:HNH endonuclease [Pirellulales bacterium]
MAKRLRPVGNGTEDSGLYTGLKLGLQFSNAVLHFLSKHPESRSTDKGIVLPINEARWQELMRKEFPRKTPCKKAWAQTLKSYCNYYNQGTHCLGFDLDNHLDFGQGSREGKQRRGKAVKGTARVLPGENSRVTVDAIIDLVLQNLERIRQPFSNSLMKSLQPHWDQAEQDGAYEILNAEDSRSYALAKLVRRLGQQIFRDKLLEAYDRQCAVTRCDCEWTLEAAHISPYKGVHTNHVCNGILLRADIHSLFDLDLIAINPETMRLELAADLEHSCYGELADREVCIPANEQLQPNRDLLNRRWKHFNEVSESVKCK